VQVVVEGNLKKQGGLLRASLRLVSVADGFQLWTRRYERGVGEFHAIAEDAADAIADSLTVRRMAAAREGTHDSGAIDLYLRARHEYHQGWVSNVGTSVALFEEALKRAPNDPRILSGFALAQMRRLGNEDSSEGAAHVALRAAERALRAAPQAGEPRVALATYHLVMGDYASAAREVNDALRRAPSLPDVHDLCGRMLVEVGRPEEGISFLERALLLEPRMYRARGDIARVSGLMGDWSRADELYASSPVDEAERSFVWFLRARLAMWRSDADWAKVARSQIAGASPFPLSAVVDAICEGIERRTAPEAVLHVLESMEKITGRVRRRPVFYRQLKAEVLAHAGDGEGAILAIEEAATLGLIDLVWLDHCPLFEGLRTVPRVVAARRLVSERAERVLEAFT
jgi:serine/threonine-protein kinase